MRAVIKMEVDLSTQIRQVLTMLLSWLRDILNALDSIYILPGVTVLRLIIAVVVIGLILSAVFVKFDGGEEFE